jgi:hypothetical protein
MSDARLYRSNGSGCAGPAVAMALIAVIVQSIVENLSFLARLLPPWGL